MDHCYMKMHAWCGMTLIKITMEKSISKFSKDGLKNTQTISFLSKISSTFIHLFHVEAENGCSREICGLRICQITYQSTILAGIENGDGIRGPEQVINPAEIIV